MTVSEEQPRTRVRVPPTTPTTHRRRRPTQAITSAFLVVLLLLGAYVAGRHGRPARQPTRHPVGPALTQPTAVRPSYQAGVPVGYPNTPAGAQSAATNYAVAYGSAAMFDPAKRHAIVTAIADPAVTQSLQPQLDGSFSAVTAGFGLDSAGRAPNGLTFVARALPVGVHLLRYDGDTAQVEVWTAGLIGLAGAKSTQPVAEAWATATISLHWVAGDWKWVSFTQHDGPTPVSGLQAPSGADQVSRAIHDFDGLRYAR